MHVCLECQWNYWTGCFSIGISINVFILFTGTGVMNLFAFHKRKNVWMKVQLFLVKVDLFKSVIKSTKTSKKSCAVLKLFVIGYDTFN